MGMIYLDPEEELEAISREIKLNAEMKQRKQFVAEQAATLVLASTPLKIDVAEIDQYPNEVYALLRKNGLGTSDSSAILGVNPYTTRAELIAEKIRPSLTEEEKLVGEKTAVKKGRDLEPLIIDKFRQYLQAEIIKPVDMYVHEAYPWIKFNFDGVTGTPEQYVPAEIKVVTVYGEKHYDRNKAWFNERDGFLNIPDNPTDRNWSIQERAAFYGIPPYYYTQLQQEIMGLNAPFGYLTVLFDKSWEVYTFFIWRDQKVIDNIITEGYKVWNMIERGRGPEWKLSLPTDWDKPVIEKE